MNILYLPTERAMPSLIVMGALASRLDEIEAELKQTNVELDHLYEMGQLSSNFHEANQNINLSMALRLRSVLVKQRGFIDRELNKLMCVLMGQEI